MVEEIGPGQDFTGTIEREELNRWGRAAGQSMSMCTRAGQLACAGLKESARKGEGINLAR